MNEACVLKCIHGEMCLFEVPPHHPHDDGDGEYKGPCREACQKGRHGACVFPRDDVGRQDGRSGPWCLDCEAAKSRVYPNTLTLECINGSLFVWGTIHTPTFL